MISKKELQYVDAWANKTPMPGVDYSLNVLKEIKKCYELFKEKYSGKEYSFILSNSKELDFVILERNLCHMFGINNDNLNNEYCKDFRKELFGTVDILSSYEFLIAILENMEKVASLDNDPNNNIKIINYYKSAVKCAIFNKFSDFSKFNFGMINETDDQKFLFVPSNEYLTPYFLMGIVKDDKFKNYVVNTLLAPTDSKQFFDNKEVVIPTQIIISNDDILTKLVATPEEKIQLLTMYSNIKNMYDIPNMINIYGDYESMLNELSNKKVLKK